LAADGLTGKIGKGAGVRSGRDGSKGAEESKIWPNKPFVQSKAVTPLSQAKKSNLFVRVGICVTEGKVLEVEEEILEVRDEEG
jgi:hypothetical protein